MRRFGELLRRAVIPALALITAFLMGAVLIVLTDFDNLTHIGTDPGAALGGAVGRVIDGYAAMLSGAIGDPGRIVTAIQSGSPSEIGSAIRPLTESLLTATPIIFVCLGLAVAFHSGLFNLGADGQFALGGLGAAITVSIVGDQLPAPLVLVVGLAGGTLFGAAYGFVPGFLKAWTGAHEVITTLMLNVIAPNLVILISSSGIFGRGARSFPQVPLIFDLPTVRLDYGSVVALLVAAAVSFVLFRTTLGFELRATGFSRSASRGAGIAPGRTTMLAMSFSGGLTGLGSALFVLGPSRGLGGGPTPDLGYIALALALIAGLRPSRVVLVAILYGALNNGAKTMVIATGIPLALLEVVIGFAMLFVAAPSLTRMIWRLRPPRPTADEPSFGM